MSDSRGPKAGDRVKDIQLDVEGTILRVSSNGDLIKWKDDNGEVYFTDTRGHSPLLWKPNE